MRVTIAAARYLVASLTAAIITCSATYAAAAAPAVLWRFDRVIPGVAWDSLGNRQAAIRAPAEKVFLSSSEDGEWPSGVLHCKGDGGYAQTIYTRHPDRQTRALWFRTTDTDQIASLMAMTSQDGDTHLSDLRLVQGELQLHIFNRAGLYVVIAQEEEVNLDPDTWHHVAAVINEREALLYLDGSQVARGTLPSLKLDVDTLILCRRFPTDSVAEQLQITSLPFKGFLNDVYFTPTALAPAEISDIGSFAVCSEDRCGASKQERE